jgi:hypothetical protein
VWGLHPSTGAVDQLLAMEHLIPPGQKKVAKVYTAACHPLLPHLVAIAANSGPLLTGAGHQTGIVMRRMSSRRLTAHRPGGCRSGIPLI